ncbi:neurotensin/neuromedin N [Nerophis ophidion]|uniref:neurotensin/neuromedin N n=1 Tax=Nerophis ophidion TaxID=159077 RepID=UPI002AE0A2C5|nr:neurotensin/neuromedin N [Nerophis ophidion]XP_061750416.1 neurotensin/neuromedin N [Nerophis ophidion]
MQIHLACVLLLGFTCGGLCAAQDVDQEQRAIEEELLSSLFASKLQQSRQSAPYWRLSLDNLCGLLSGLRQEAWRSSEEEEEEDAEGEEQPRERGVQRLEELYRLQHICRALQSQEDRLRHASLEYAPQNGETLLKRKSPYILKRQASHRPKSRRPYILKRSAIY